jgi:PAS domain S-box-containing protein
MRHPPYDVSVLHHKGQLRILEVMAIPVLEDGSVTGVEGIAHDVTDLRALMEEHKAYYEAFQHSPHGVVITDVAGRIRYVNKRFQELYGFTQEEARGQTPRLLNPGREVYREYGVDGAAYERLFAEMWEQAGDPKVGYWEGDVVNRTKDGQELWVHLIINSIRDRRGEVVAYLGMPIDVTERRKMELEVRIECYRALAELAEQRDNETGAHMSRIGAYAACLARRLDQPRKYCEDIEIFAPLHDIGKVAIADDILMAPRKLSEDEFEIMKSHAAVGHRILAGRPTLEMAAEIAGGHHERWNGRGYPEGLSGEAIPLSARIVALTDVYDALRSHRPYKEPWPTDKVVELMREERGEHFDPRVVDAFLEAREEFDAIFEEMTAENDV